MFRIEALFLSLVWLLFLVGEEGLVSGLNLSLHM